MEQVVSPVAYKLHLPRAQERVHNVFQVSVLKRYHEREDVEMQVVTQDPDDIDELTEDQVLKVLR